MRINQFYGSMQIVDFMKQYHAYKHDPLHLNSVVFFIGRYSDFPGHSTFTDLLFNAFAYLAKNVTYCIPTYEESSEIVDKYCAVLNELFNNPENLKLNEYELKELASQHCEIPNPVHSFIREHYIDILWELAFKRAAEYFVNVEYQKHHYNINQMLLNKDVEI